MACVSYQLVHRIVGFLQLWQIRIVYILPYVEHPPSRGLSADQNQLLNEQLLAQRVDRASEIFRQFCNLQTDIFKSTTGHQRFAKTKAGANLVNDSI